MQTPEDVQFVQRRVKAISLDVHPTDKALIISYELEAALVGQLGDTMLEETKECQKIIRVKSLSENSDVTVLAKEIIDKFDIIPPTKLKEIEVLLTYLKNRRQQTINEEIAERLKSSVSQNEKEDLFEEITEIASLNKLDNYIELLYEDIPGKIKGSALVLQLAKSSQNLSILVNNEMFLSALARVLREDGRKSLDLSTNILYVFYCFSVYSQFHPIIIQLKLGSMCMDIIDFELKRYEQWKEDLSKKRSITETEKDNLSAHKDYEKSLKKYHTVIKKQNQLLRVSFSLLLNIAEDPKVEIRMASRGIVSLLVKTLDREPPELLLLIVTFLKKLSIFLENKNEMAKMNIIEKLAPLVSTNHHDLLNMTLRLLLNLSFDIELRNNMVKQGLLPKLVDITTFENHCKTVLFILNHISMDDRCKSMFTYTDCIPILMKLILECPEDKIPFELVSLAINLAANKRNAQLICEENGLKLLLKRALRSQDPLLMKMVRNIAQHDGPTKDMFLDFVSILGSCIQSCDNEEFVIECIGVLGNLNIPNMNFEKLFTKFHIFPWLKSKLDLDSCEDDLLLEIIVLIGTSMTDEGAARLFLKEGILNKIMDLLNAKQEDDEVVLQILYLFQQLLKHVDIRKFLVKDTHVPAYLIDLMHDKNDEIRKVCMATLDIVAEENKEWSQKIQYEKFRWHNAHWLEVIEKGEEEPFEAYNDDTNIFEQMKLIYSLGDQEDFLTDEEEDSFSNDSDSSKPSTSSLGSRPHSRYKNRSSTSHLPVC